MAVLVPHSPTPSHHTATVTWPELQRLVSLATACLDLLATPLAMFEPDMSCYVALIQLRPLQVPSRRLAVRCARPAERPEGEPEVATIPIVEHEPVALYVAQLEAAYGSLANFYYDRFGGSVVAVKLVAAREGGKVGQVAAREARDGGLAVNWGAVMEDWRVLGDGLVREVQVLDTDAMLAHD